MTLTIFRRKRRGKAITVRPRFSILAVMALAAGLAGYRRQRPEHAGQLLAQHQEDHPIEGSLQHGPV
jgi:hypothetical protein